MNIFFINFVKITFAINVCTFDGCHVCLGPNKRAHKWCGHDLLVVCCLYVT